MILGYDITESDTSMIERSMLLVVGVLSGTGDHVGHNRKSQGSKSYPISVIAGWQEFGTDHKTYKLPARPFMRNTFSPESRQAIVFDLFVEMGQKVANGTLSQQQAMGAIGAKLASDVQQEMDKLGVVDTGLTKRHITWDSVDL